MMKILVGYDGSKPARKAIELAVKYAKAFDASVLVVTSLIGGTISDVDHKYHAEEEFEAIQQLFKRENISCSTDLLVRGLSPGEDITMYAEENNVDLIFIGVKKKVKSMKLLFGSNAQYVTLNAHCPVVNVN